ncbi:MAG: HAD family hydrolase [Nitrososphaera sp.]
MKSSNRFKSVVFDVDGTLISEASSWVLVHNYFGTAAQAKQNLMRYEKGEIDYPTFMRSDISLWPKRLQLQDIKKILSKYTLDPDAKPVIEKLRSAGIKVVFISAGIDTLTEQVASVLAPDDYLANGLEIDDEGYLTGNGIFRVDLINKQEAMKKILDRLSCPYSACVAVGDSRFDVSMLKSAGCGVAFKAEKILEESAHYRINDLRHLLEIVL